MNQVRYVLLVITLIALVGVSALALNVPNTFVSGDVISAAEMNANFAAVEAAVTALEASVAELSATQPVVAHAKVDFNVNFTAATIEAQDLVAVEITVPAAGIVVVEAAMQSAFNSTTEANQSVLTLDTEPGGALGITGTQSYVFGATVPPNAGTFFAPASLRRVFDVEAGTHTFRLKGFNASETGNRYVYNPSITATWYPASSATVSVAPSALVAPVGTEQDR